jgi:hypothetical protein
MLGQVNLMTERVGVAFNATLSIEAGSEPQLAALSRFQTRPEARWPNPFWNQNAAV